MTSHEQVMLVYDDRKGLYGGAVIKGGAVSPESGANRAYYGEALYQAGAREMRRYVELEEKGRSVRSGDRGGPP